MLSPHITARRVAPRPAVRSSRAVLFIVILISVAISTAAFASERALTLAEAQQRAVERSRLLAAKDYAAQSSREMSVAAGQLPDPLLKVGVDSLPIEGRDRFSLTRDSMTQQRIGVMQELTRADKRRLRAERFEHEAEKSIAEKAATTAEIERSTALAWLDRYYTEAMSAVIAEQISQAQLEIQAAESAYRSGRGNQADIFSARSVLVSLEDKASDINRRIGNAKIALARWVGDAAQLPLGAKPAVDAIRLDEATLDTQLGHHPELAVLTKQEDIATTEAHLAKANKKGDWSVEVAVQKRGPGYSDMLSIGLSVPLQWDQKNRQDRELSSKLAQVEQARAEREDALRAHVAEVRGMLNDWHTDRQRQTRYEQELIPLAHSRITASLAAYRGGKATLADVLAARRSEIDVRLQALQLGQETDRLWAQLNFLFPQNGISSH
ncbi:TolC family protein [Massilia sp. NP310]|jgi:outer membrane protein TolC|uniref:TolC family protein n=1 Tax=Massilia sp. NP310 TaxID=2861282 RepID=UPI001C639312|nr:TolC family protein [Massilia sp. NP310]QYG02730.1 TolC family protein [Massilia sp. NP310]